MAVAGMAALEAGFAAGEGRWSFGEQKRGMAAVECFILYAFPASYTDVKKLRGLEQDPPIMPTESWTLETLAGFIAFCSGSPDVKFPFQGTALLEAPP